MAMLKKFATFAATAGLIMTSIQPTLAAQYYDENEFGPNYESMVVDTVAGKPLQVAAAVAGTATFLVSYPFSLMTDSGEEAAQTLVHEPWEAVIDRCLGCTEAESEYRNIQRMQNDGYIRMVITEPSEVLIKTNENVIIRNGTESAIGR